MEEVPQINIKQEKVDIFPATNTNVNYETKAQDLIEIKPEPIKIEPCFYVPELNISDQEFKLTEEAKIIGNYDEYMLDDSKGFTLEEALNIVYDEDVDVEQIFIEPPDPNILTDEDSGDEDEGALKQLLAQIEIRIRTNRQGNGSEDTPVQTTVSKASNVPERPGKNKITWIDGDLIPTDREFLKPNLTGYMHLCPTEILEKFLDDEIFQFIANESNKYALFLNDPHPKITVDEIKCCFAILILTGYAELPGKYFYWDSQKDMRNEMVSQAMRRDRFRQILKYLHCADNNKPDKSDKVWKLRPLIDMIKQKFVKNWIPEQNLYYDESMIKYCGRHSRKQFTRGKPIRFGYKMWCLNASSGYLVNFDLYQGKNPRGNIFYEQKFGKNIAPMLSMIDEFPENIKSLPFRFYFDNLFTGFDVLYYLKQRGYDGTGTIQENRLPKSCPLLVENELKNEKQGNYIAKIDKEDGIMVVKWIDSNVVTSASTCHGIHPITVVKRFSRTDKKVIYVNRPSLITEYNRFMGGTDLLDENTSRYRISIRRKKWWWSIFTWMLDVSLVNAWIIYRQYAPVTQLQFRRQVVQTYLTRYGLPPKGWGRPPTSRSSVTLNRVSDDLRYDGRNHLLVSNENKKRRRCAGEGCSSSVRTKCRKCDVGLCIECNEMFHTQ